MVWSSLRQFSPFSLIVNKKPSLKRGCVRLLSWSLGDVAEYRVGANALLFCYFGDENGPEKIGGAAISMVIHFCSDIWRGYTPPAQNTQIHAVTYAPTLLCANVTGKRS